MCHFALVGAQTDPVQLRGLLVGPDAELDTDVSPASSALERFAPSDSVLCVTKDGCSCALLPGLGQAGGVQREAHFAGPGYVFRRALAAAALRYGSVRLLVYDRSKSASAEPTSKRRTTTLGQFLRFGLEPDDGLVCIIS